MQGPHDAKKYIQRYSEHLKAVYWDDLAIFKWERCKKWRKQNRRARDGSYGTSAQYDNEI